MPEPRKPYKTVVIDGFEILIGRSDLENDELTFEVAEKSDVWLHVGGEFSGSHVVIRKPPDLGEIPRNILVRAAELAAWHSKARGHKKVEVHYCFAGQVSKKKTDPPGTVRLSRFRQIKVSPKQA